MTLAQLVPLALQGSVMAVVFTLGLRTSPRELTYFLRHPGQFWRSLASMNLAMPVIAILIVGLLSLEGPVAVMLVALSLAPVPPILPNRLVRAGGDRDYAAALLVTMAMVAIVWMPLAGAVLDRILPADISIPPLPVARLALLTVLGPVVAGMIVRVVAPRFAQRLAKPLGVAAMALLLGFALLLLVKAGPAMLALIGNGTLVAIVAFLVLGLAAGHLLGGPNPADRTVLALATASRHPAIAMAIARIAFPEEKAVPAAVLLYLIVSLVVTTPYVMWRKKAAAGVVAPGVGAPVARQRPG